MSTQDKQNDATAGSTLLSAAEILYPNMKARQVDISPVKSAGMDEKEFALRQLYPSMFGSDAWFAKFYEREKDNWD